MGQKAILKFPCKTYVVYFYKVRFYIYVPIPAALVIWIFVINIDKNFYQLCLYHYQPLPHVLVFWRLVNYYIIWMWQHWQWIQHSCTYIFLSTTVSTIPYYTNIRKKKLYVYQNLNHVFSVWSSCGIILFPFMKKIWVKNSMTQWISWLRQWNSILQGTRVPYKTTNSYRKPRSTTLIWNTFHLN